MAGYLFLFLVSAGLGAVVAWLIARSKTTSLEQLLSMSRQDLAGALAELKTQRELNGNLRVETAQVKTQLEAAHTQADEKLAVLNRASEQLREAFRSLSSEALQSNNQSFLELAKTALEKYQSEARGDLEQRTQAVENIVAPIKESLARVDAEIRQVEQSRSQAYGELSEQMRSLASTQQKLEAQTGNLVKALRSPTVRGRWGEIQLKRVVEIAGMLPYCDFVEQETVTTESGRLRPDLIVKLPGGKNIVVDAKTPLQAYLEALESKDDEARRVHLADHARQVRDHMNKLSGKAYWEQFQPTPEFVIMFLPGETFFSAALEQDPSLIEEGVKQGVIPASPTTLIALLRAVAYGWRQERIAESAQKISELGKELHERLRTMTAHFESLGNNLDRAVEHYNKAVGSFESRVLVSARKFSELGAPITTQIGELDQLQTTARTLQLEWDEEPADIKASGNGDLSKAAETGS
ncbi:MAG TPA: DNA recombination protein RmuC [Terriglobales bacterium]|nr:DNA recombination protein RmuC [Terriglobales bacterium]